MPSSPVAHDVQIELPVHSPNSRSQQSLSDEVIIQMAQEQDGSLPAKVKRYPAVDWLVPMIPSKIHAGSPSGSENVLSSTSVGKTKISIGADGHFKDQFGRTLILRGVNICAKIPAGHYLKSDIHDREIFFNHRNVSFVNEPFPLNEADEHFDRLKLWGLTFIRLGITWEALEHAGPGNYDMVYIQYLRDLIQKADDHGFRVIIDPHQDTWSRYSGGSGAPGWTFEVANLDITKFRETGAAYVHIWDRELKQKMLWPTNYSKIASQTMFTLFFAGNTFAPNLKYQGVPVQDYLQQCYINCFAHLATCLKDMPAILGFEIMNEPHHGFIGIPTLGCYDPDKNLHLGEAPSAIQSFAMGEGITQKVDLYKQSFPWPTRRHASKIMNSAKQNHWLNGKCIWKDQGVWSFQSDRRGNRIPVLDKPDYFYRDPVTRKPVSFNQDFYVPFMRKYSVLVQKAFSEQVERLFMFVEPIPNEDPMNLENEQEANDMGLGSTLVYAPHWYDLSTLFTKSFNGVIAYNVQELSRGSRNLLKHIYIGSRGIQNNYYNQISKIARVGRRNLNKAVMKHKGIPVIFGECGIPMDMNNHRGYNEDDYRLHNFAMDSMFQAMEKAHISGYTLWNYNPKNEVTFGDSWNGEDFSIYCKTIARDKFKETSNSGGRVLEAIIRPYAAKIAGELQLTKFDYNKKVYILKFKTPDVIRQTQSAAKLAVGPQITRQTEIFVPEYHFNQHENGDDEHPCKSIEIIVSDGQFYYDFDKQTLYYWHADHANEHTVIIRKRKCEGKSSRLTPEHLVSHHYKNRTWYRICAKTIKVLTLITFMLLLLVFRTFLIFT